jgi:hypothetical protein
MQLRICFTVLNLWESEDLDEVVEFHLHLLPLKLKFTYLVCVLSHTYCLCNYFLLFYFIFLQICLNYTKDTCPVTNVKTGNLNCIPNLALNFIICNFCSFCRGMSTGCMKKQPHNRVIQCTTMLVSCRLLVTLTWIQCRLAEATEI